MGGDTPSFHVKKNNSPPIGYPLSPDHYPFPSLVNSSLIIHCTTSLSFRISNMAAYSDIPTQPMQDLTNFMDDLPPGLANGTLLNATRMVLEQDNTQEWIVDMLTLDKYYRVKYKKRSTVEKFIGHMAFLAEHKENQQYTDQQLENMEKTVKDLTKWIDQRKVECLDDSYWPVSSRYVFNLKCIYTAFPTWQDMSYHRVIQWHDRMLDIKEELERETSPEHGLSMRDIFQAHLENMLPNETEMYVSGSLIPPPLESDIEHTVV